MRCFRFLAAGNAASAYGVYLNLVAFNLFVYEVTDSALQTGLVMAVRLLVGLIGGVLAGRLAARLDLKRMMITAETTQALGLISLVVFHRFTGDWLLYAFVVVAGLCSNSSAVALRTAVPAMVGADKRVWANGLLAGCRSVAMVAGFASAGVVVSLFGHTAAFLMAAGTFALSAANLAWLPLRTRTESEEAGTVEHESSAPGAAGAEDERPTRARRMAALALGGLPPLVLMLVAVRAVDGFGSSAHNVGMPIQSRALDPDDPAVFMSQFWTTWAIGNLIAQRLTTRYAERRGAPSDTAFAVGVMVMSAAFILAFAGLPAVLALPVIVLAGMADGFTENAFVSRLQTLPEKRRAAAFGLAATTENTAFGLGMVISASLLERFSPFGVVGAMHGAALVLGLGFLLVRRRLAAASREAVRGAADAAPESKREVNQ
ncbi:MFS transporter [Streptomyces ovatisporus]|uniref:MFS transporter n=1 Tax=Streptomyces ovatisporus TaxID=1128682 RepID=A0ABV9AD37_9ACTN